VGDKIKANEVIGLSGNTGNSTGPHLHYEVRRSGQQINPTSFTLK
jgi:murein DD-endopeptidase MepM/ murein hydrolase activator NlpD